MDIKKALKFVLKPFVKALGFAIKSFFKVLPDGAKCIIRYIYYLKRIPNLKSPKTFNEKILCKMLFDRNPQLTIFADKYLARDFVKSRLNSDEHLTKLYAVVDSVEEISNLNLPNQFVMKPNHLSGPVKIVRDFKSILPGELEKLAEEWLQKNYYTLSYEWAYKNIKPCIIFEELLKINENIPDDWKFFCFNGQPRYIYIDRRDKFPKHQINYYDLNLSLLPVRNCEYENFQEKIDTPLKFDMMLEIAKRLSSGIDFIRVDLYNINGRIIFGELTNYPTQGIGKFDPPSWDTTFGSYWK